MFGLSRILFPTDLSPASGQAFLQAASLAARTAAEVHVLHVAPDLPAAPDGDAAPVAFDEARLREQLQIDLHTWHAHVGAGRTRRARFVQAEVRGLPPAVAILAYAARHEADLVVMGTHGRRRLRHLLFGSVAEAVVRESPCPVMTVRQAGPSQPVRIEHVVVPVDFSAQSGPAIAFARRIALLHRAAVSLLFVAESHVVPVPCDTGVPALVLFGTDPEITGRAEEALRQLDAATEAPAVPTTYQVTHGDPAHEVAAFALARGADLVVVSRRGHTPAEGSRLSPVTEQVVRTAPCPVVTLPVADAPTPADDEAHEAGGAHPASFVERYHHGPL